MPRHRKQDISTSSHKAGTKRMTGDELKQHRLHLGLSRPALAALAGLHPSSVKYWERKGEARIRGHAPSRLLLAMGLEVPKRPQIFQRLGRGWDNFATTTRARGGVLGSAADQSFSKQCGARTRKGTACRSRPIPGKRRCRFHGGLSSGPKTQAGRNRIAEAQRKRWALCRGKRFIASGARADLGRQVKAPSDE
ncbi:HGGxSTG domain-containing protein [Phaeobacter gallaeciensis]|uniref:HGGxSTG domain-containing protein n=2 Tax=Phaeobacter gallaeciensis TaxID=60890 RepID=UPI003CD01A43